MPYAGASWVDVRSIRHHFIAQPNMVCDYICDKLEKGGWKVSKEKQIENCDGSITAITARSYCKKGGGQKQEMLYPGRHHSIRAGRQTNRDS